MARGNVKIDLGESLTIDHVTGIRNKFDKKAMEGARILLHSSGIADIDLTGIQLLHYMMVQAKKRKTDLRFELVLDEDQKAILHRCGFKTISQTVFS